MRVGLLAHAARVGDAIGRQIAAKLDFFRDCGAEVRAILATDGSVDARLRPFIQRLSPQRPEASVAWLRSCDLVLVEYSQHSPVLDLLPQIAGGRPRIIVDYHGVTPPALGAGSHRDALVRGLEARNLIWFADAAIAHSQFASDELRAATGYPAERLKRLGYPIDAPADDDGALPESLPDARVLLCVGRFAPNKRTSILVRALPLLPADVHAVFIGDAGDSYALEQQRCREWAARLGVTNRVHFWGAVSDRVLRAAYRRAQMLVVPSVHEAYCLPVIEAMGQGLPVIAARAAALPETLGSAGFTFEPDDPQDLARQALRVLTAEGLSRQNRRIAVVAQQFGDGFVGGAERSLRLLAKRMRLAGFDVTIFALGKNDEHAVADDLPIHRFRADPGDADRRAAAAHAILLANGDVDADTETEFLEHLPRSARLVAALRQAGPFDAIVAGPYLSRLTFDVAEAFPKQTILLPCWHDEPAARLAAWRQAYRGVGGVLYHSAQEQQFAENELGVNHPNSSVIGTVIDTATPGDARRGRDMVGGGRRYLLFAGRRSAEKGFDTLLGHMSRYADEQPNRFSIAIVGDGDSAGPAQPWIRNLGYVTEDARRDVMAGADALVNLSRHESLSLAALEAQALGVPVIVTAGNRVLRKHLTLGGGGIAVEDYESFAAALDDLWADNNHWRELGGQGRDYVVRHFSDAAAFDRQWRAVFDGLAQPLAAIMHRAGRARAAACSAAVWREEFAQIVERVTHEPRRDAECRVIVRPRSKVIAAPADAGETLIPVRLTVQGDWPALADGLTRHEIVTCPLDRDGPMLATPLPASIVPGSSVAAIARVAVPESPGEYVVGVRANRRSGPDDDTWVQVTLRVTAAGVETDEPIVAAGFRAALLAAEQARHLPTGYVDVSLGRFARFKRWIKRKLLHNFQTAYVDVLARQQAAFNRSVIAALAELSDAQSRLAHARSVPRRRDKLRARIEAVREEAA